MGNNHEQSELDVMNAYMHGVTDEQKQQWLRLRNQAQQFHSVLDKWSQEQSLPEHLRQSITTSRQKLTDALDKYLNYKRRYTISVAGATGAGKSTLINALLGMNLLATAKGDSITGTLVTVSLVKAADIQPSDVDDTRPVLGQALIHYHTIKSLTRLVQDQCQLIGIDATSLPYQHDAPHYVDVGTMIDWVEQWKKGQAVVNKEGQTVAPDPNKIANQPKMLDALEDLLRIANRNLPQLNQEQWEERRLLSDGNDVQYVQDLMNELSDTNRIKGTRIIPLIRAITCEVVQPNESDGLLFVNLTDVPGSAASNARHEQHVRDYLNPRTIDAIILVMDDERPKRAEEELVPMVKTALASLSDPKDLRAAVDRTFLVVSTRDLSGDVHGEFRSNVQQAVKAVANAIIPGTFEDTAWRSTNVFDNVMSRSALIAQALMTHPDEAAKWQNSERTPFFPPKLQDEPYYEAVIVAKQRHPDQSDETAVLQWSSLPRIRTALKDFLSRSRWQLDMTEAQKLYTSSYADINDNIHLQWLQITGKEPSNDPTRDRQQLDNDSLDRYLEQVRTEARGISKRFQFVRNALSDDKPAKIKTLEQQINAVVNQVEAAMKTYTNQPDFKDTLFHATRTWRGDIYLEPSFAKELDKLETYVLRQFDDRVASIADTMQQLLLHHLDQQQLGHFLEHICHGLDGFEPLVQKYQTIIKKVVTDYAQASRGVVLTRMMEHRVMHTFMQQSQKASNPTTSDAITDTDDNQTTANGGFDVTQLVGRYHKIHLDLAKDVPTQLYDLFLYHLTQIETQLQKLAEETENALIKEVVQNNTGNLVRRMQTQDRNLFDFADIATTIRQDLATLMPAS